MKGLLFIIMAGITGCNDITRTVPVVNGQPIAGHYVCEYAVLYYSYPGRQLMVDKNKSPIPCTTTTVSHKEYKALLRNKRKPQ